MSRHARYYQENKETRQVESRAYYAANKELRRAHNRRAYQKNKKKLAEAKHLKLYGITMSEREAIFLAQGSVCAACGSADPSHKNGWAIDHCHNTSKIRGILCQPCNVSAGLIGESPERLRKLADYLERTA